MHVHLGLLHAYIVFVNVIIIGFFWRWLAMKNAQTAWGQAMAFLY